MPNRKEIFLALRDAHQLPAPPPTALELLRRCRDEETSLEEIARIVQTDPTLSAELLRYANSAFLSTGVQIASIHRAVVKLGVRTVSHLCVCLSLIGSNRKGSCQGFDYDRFWSLALLRGISGKTLASRISGLDPDEMFSCAMLSHMGELVLATIFPDEYEVILAEHESGDTRRTMERMRFEIDSAELTTELFLDWGLPVHYALAAGFHEELDKSELGESTTRKAAELLHLCCRISVLCSGEPVSATWIEETEDLAAAVIGDSAALPALVDTIAEQWQHWGAAFSIATVDVPPYEELKNGV